MMPTETSLRIASSFVRYLEESRGRHEVAIPPRMRCSMRVRARLVQPDPDLSIRRPTIARAPVRACWPGGRDLFIGRLSSKHKVWNAPATTAKRAFAPILRIGSGSEMKEQKRASQHSWVGN